MSELMHWETYDNWLEECKDFCIIGNGTEIHDWYVTKYHNPSLGICDAFSKEELLDYEMHPKNGPLEWNDYYGITFTTEHSQLPNWHNMGEPLNHIDQIFDKINFRESISTRYPVINNLIPPELIVAALQAAYLTGEGYPTNINYQGE